MERPLDAALSYLMCPALNEAMLIKSAGRGADVVVVDLEESVPLRAKPEARAIARRVTSEIEGAFVIRINDPMVDSGQMVLNDLAAILHPGIAGLVVPKVETRAALELVFRVLDASPSVRPDFEVIPTIETPAGVEALHQFILGNDRWLARMAFGAGDYTASLGVEWSHRPGQMLYPRSRIAAMSSARGLAGPIDTGSPLLNDRETFMADGMEGKLLGFKAKFCINPRQIEWVHDLFRHTAAEIARATKIVEAYERAAVEKAELVASAEGWMLDAPIVKRSFTILKQAGLRP